MNTTKQNLNCRSVCLVSSLAQGLTAWSGSIFGLKMNTTQTKHTALPWKAEIWKYDQPRGEKWVLVNGVDAIAEIIPLFRRVPENKIEAEANAAFIVRACNSHYELLRVSKEMTMLAEALLERLPDEPRNRDCYKRTIAAANAIALAEKGEQ